MERPIKEQTSYESVTVLFIPDEEWSIYIKKLEKKLENDSDKENNLIHRINIALMNFIESTAPKFPI